MQKQLAIELNESYVEYYNYFPTIEYYAEYKGWSLFFAKQVIKAGMKINNDKHLLNELYNKYS